MYLFLEMPAIINCLPSLAERWSLWDSFVHSYTHSYKGVCISYMFSDIFPKKKLTKRRTKNIFF